MTQDLSAMPPQDLDPTNPIVIAMTQKRILEQMEEMTLQMKEVMDALREMPKCQNPNACNEIRQEVLALKDEVKALKELSSEWKLIAADREKRIAALEAVMLKAQGAAWAVKLAWIVGTSGAIGWAIVLFNMVKEWAKKA